MNFMKFIIEVWKIIKMGMEVVLDFVFKDSNGNTSILGHISFMYLSFTLVLNILQLVMDSFNEFGAIIYDERVRDRWG